MTYLLSGLPPLAFSGQTAKMCIDLALAYGASAITLPCDLQEAGGVLLWLGCQPPGSDCLRRKRKWSELEFYLSFALRQFKQIYYSVCEVISLPFRILELRCLLFRKVKERTMSQYDVPHLM